MIPGMIERAFRLMSSVPTDGCLVEFGVYQGRGLRTMGRLARKHLSSTPPIYGFDTFEGMPLSDVALDGNLEAEWAPGTFSDTSVASVRRMLDIAGVEATLIRGTFGALGPLPQYGISQVRFAHIDADLYEGYRDALHLLTPHLSVGSIILFDESIPPTHHAYQGVREHGQRAVREWEAETGLNLHLIRFDWTVALTVIVDDNYLRSYSQLLVRLRRDTVVESARSLLKTAAGR